MTTIANHATTRLRQSRRGVKEINKSRRDRINAIVAKLQEIQTEIEDVLSEEQDAFDNMPEGLQSSERGDRAQEAISNLESASLEDAISHLESAAE